MIDRAARNQSLLAIDRFLEGRTTSFHFDEEMHAIDTEDETVREVRFLAWFHYDDVIDHPIKMCRAQWKFFQRLRLALQSNAELRRLSHWNWTLEHSFALAALVGLGMTAVLFGIGQVLLVTNISLGVVFFTLYWIRSRRKPTFVETWRRELFPFGSFEAMRKARESAREFCQVPYPKDMDLTCLRSRQTTVFMHLAWLLATPVMLTAVFFQARYSTFELISGRPDEGA